MMISEYIEVLESFKEHQISKLIEKIRDKLFAGLKNPAFNPQIAPYFTKVNTEGPPFTEFDLDPDNVSQIKKLINALYFARRSFIDLENIKIQPDNFPNTFAELQIIYNKTIEDAYQASYLATHLDVDIQDMFREEFELFIPMIVRFQTAAAQNSDQTKQLAETIKAYPLSYKVGEVTGTMIEQMQPSNGDLDYDFLTQFSAVLPGYIDKVTQFLRQYSSQIIKQEPTLNNDKIEELQNAALKLLNDLENLKGNYIHIIRNILTLAMSSLEQMGHLSDSSQDFIRENLARLKYSDLPTLFGLVDKIEVNSMLKPGTLSTPLMEKIKPLYQVLIEYASKPVNFQEKGEELLTIEDSRFLTLRLELTYKRIDSANNALFKIAKAEEALIQFFAILQKSSHKDAILHQLPQETKDQLIGHYKLIEPYMAQVDVDLNDNIINGLIRNEESWSSYLSTPWRWFNNQLPADHVSTLLAKKENLERFITKKKNTQEFHLKLNAQLIDSVQKQTDLHLYPYSEEANFFNLNHVAEHTKPPQKITPVFTIDESKIITPEEGQAELTFKLQEKDNLLINPQALTAAQTLKLHSWYKNNHQQLLEAKTAYDNLTSLITKYNEIEVPDHKLHLNNLPPNIKAQCQKLYHLIYPYLLNATAKEMRDSLVTFHSDFIELLAEGKEPSGPLVDIFEKLHEPIQALFSNADANWKKRSTVYLKWTQKKYFKEEANLFLIDEGKVLRSSTKISSIAVTKNNEHQYITDPSKLTADQALMLYQWYRNKHNKFVIARQAYNEFTLLLSTYSKENSDGSASLYLYQLSKEDKVICRRLYNQFQPYFVNGVPGDMRSSAIAFDKVLVHAFAEKTPPNDTPTGDLLKNLEEHFQKLFTSIDLDWAKRGNAYLIRADQQFSIENNIALLEQQKDTASRAHFLIKHTHYSQFINEFRQSLEHILPLFNYSMQASLKVKSAGIPFPELEDKHLALTQSRQVIALKQILNSLYHVEGIVRQLELLNDKSYKTTYVYHLIFAYKHTNEIMKLTKSLAADPHFGLIGRDLLDKAQIAWATLQEHTDTYKYSSEQIKDGTVVKFSALWYSLNAFYISPKHIRSLSNNNYLTTKELDELHSRAKKASVNIEAIIGSSHSYFKLFLQAPTMFKLYKELSGKLNEFITTTHDTAMSNLAKFHPKIFTPMLLEADLWEDQLGLLPGTFSEPLKKIITESNKGLLH
ncbi:MAG: SdhA, partial [bacterium]|nr:SdhA [bacterium]